MEQTIAEYDRDLEQKLCPLCSKPMQKIEVATARHDYVLWTCVPCVKEADKKRRRQQGSQ